MNKTTTIDEFHSIFSNIKCVYPVDYEGTIEDCFLRLIWAAFPEYDGFVWRRHGVARPKDGPFIHISWKSGSLYNALHRFMRSVQKIDKTARLQVFCYTTDECLILSGKGRDGRWTSAPILTLSCIRETLEQNDQEYRRLQAMRRMKPKSLQRLCAARSQ